MKKSRKKENMDSKERNQKEAERSEARNSESPAEKAGETKVSPENEPSSPEAEKNPEEACREENEILKDQLFRLAADFDNFRKRTARQMEENRKSVLEQVLLDFVEVTDNFDRAIKSARTAEDMGPIVSGIEQLSKQFFSILEKYGLERVKCEKAGEFDPHRHEAIHHIETSEVPDNTIVEIYKEGYALNEKVVRPALVSVARSPEEAEK
ncbi:nucleotide exchange factor GrpE [Methanosarcina mazei]|jgi:molecular chaperone GrpE|uniref:Protein GrpE n=8 Tax=Methanosarcina mazei TaxID=2209 RepID=GRPE_METMA|nr:nucleotide exchange factor GrpE [Methanosarcina mazei]P0CW10.1 RecName: Full=Protein GrpE; AltName: Full=HSP-70 cofactor [Methanosarcina mazei]P0CW11.1 RecName: Full=Protein GrpE; AltName: Full=HSP-70 cofactor [Methanosarcina mazei Go1]AKB41185.1 Heat shock protein GrpE [Methanosarcina mazei WWM610]AKB62062.1 Heat shock protein GrpE [Methanosarcina mazei SarPi]AKB65391.1 Heat shock protein GrpE [Methanosarcina mazei S-6]AKB69450.1 Heat shock protein GrpE [Methanosarcina mazei LYC]AKB72149